MNPITLYQKVLADPKTRYWIIALTLIYLVSPFDVIPDIFFPFGYIDDGVLVSLMSVELIKVFLESRKSKKDVK